jgi:hypothetical protein
MLRIEVADRGRRQGFRSEGNCRETGHGHGSVDGREVVIGGTQRAGGDGILAVGAVAGGRRGEDGCAAAQADGCVTIDKPCVGSSNSATPLAHTQSSG